MLAALPSLKTLYNPDLIIGNVENLAHGKGVTVSTLDELGAGGMQVFTSGNHVFDKPDSLSDAQMKYSTLIRPANYTGDVVGKGFCRITVNGQNVLVVNLGGKAFFEKQYKGEIGNPFTFIDTFLATNSEPGDIILVDFHAEASSEKVAMGLHLDGRATAMWGTHTHVPTADTRVLPKGTGYQTDLGMCGAQNSIIGIKASVVLPVFLETGKFKMDPDEEPPFVVNGMFIETEGVKTSKVERIQQIVK